MTKLCSKCGQPNEFGKCGKSKDGLKSACKICLRSACREYMLKQRLTNRDELNRRTKESKLKRIEANPDFYKDEYNKKREVHRGRARRYYHNNINKCLGGQKIWRSKNTELCRQISRNWKKMHPERTRQLSRASGETYRARKRMAQITKFSVQQLELRMSVFGFKCAYCGGNFEHIDHVIPLSKGGKHCLSNLRPACKKCNQSKSNRLLKEWLGSK